MQIVIDIPEEYYNLLKEFDYEKCSMDMLLLKNGIPLPKGHGRLIDADEFEELFGKMCPTDCGACAPNRKTDGRGRWYDTCSLIDVASTIIEADTEESENKLDSDPVDIDKAVEHYEGTLETLKGVDLEVDG